MRGREREREIDWDEEMRGWIKRGGGEIREWLNVEKTLLYIITVKACICTGLPPAF